MGSFHILIVVNSVAMNMGLQVSESHFQFLRKYPEVESIDHVAVLGLIFGGTTILFPTAAALFYIPTGSAPGLHFLGILANTCSLLF